MIRKRAQPSSKLEVIWPVGPCFCFLEKQWVSLLFYWVWLSGTACLRAFNWFWATFHLVLHASEISVDSEQPYCNVLVSEGWHSMLNIASIFPVKLLAWDNPCTKLLHYFFCFLHGINLSASLICNLQEQHKCTNDLLNIHASWSFRVVLLCFLCFNSVGFY